MKTIRFERSAFPILWFSWFPRYANFKVFKVVQQPFKFFPSVRIPGVARPHGHEFCRSRVPRGNFGRMSLPAPSWSRVLAVDGTPVHFGRVSYPAPSWLEPFSRRRDAYVALLSSTAHRLAQHPPCAHGADIGQRHSFSFWLCRRVRSAVRPRTRPFELC